MTSPPAAAHSETTANVVRTSPDRRWRPVSLLLILLPWLLLQLGGLFSPGLLDDVDSIYLQIAREMLHRHDFVTPTIDGVRFFDKPPLPYWMAAGSMRLFGEHDWAARLPLALGVLALLYAVYALGLRLFARLGPPGKADRAGLYAALALATSIGPYLYTRFYIPDILIALWMTLSVYLLLVAEERVALGRSALWPSFGFGAVAALSLLTKGLIGIVFPLAVTFLYLGLTRQLPLLRRLHLLAGTLAFLGLAAPWHVLAAWRNPAIAMPAGVGLPARAGWAWFYLYNEHIARFAGRRIPHDYGQVPIPLFWLLLVLWLMPWAAFLPAALWSAGRTLRQGAHARLRFDSDAEASFALSADHIDFTAGSKLSLERGALILLLWAGTILGFFTLSSRQEYYHLPALPALALLTGALLAAADRSLFLSASSGVKAELHMERAPAFWTGAARQVRRSSLYALVPLGLGLFLLCTFLALTAHRPAAGVSLDQLLSSNPELYNLSLGHVFDLTAEAMGFFQGPLLTVGLAMLLLGPGTHLLRRRGYTLAANLVLAGAMSAVLLAAHEGLVRFYPILGSEDLAEAIEAQRGITDRVLIDGELTAGSTLLFYTNASVGLVNGRVNGPWFGGFWPDAPHIFLGDRDLEVLWAGPQRVFLLTYTPAKRFPELARFGPVYNFAASGGKTILTNRKR